MTPDELAGRLTVTVPEAAKALGIGRDSAYRAAADGSLPTLRIGRRIVVPVPRLLELLGSGEQPQMLRDASLTVVPFRSA